MLSAALHAAPLVWGAFSLFPELEMPEIEFEFQEVELLDPDQIQHETAIEPPPEVTAPPEAPPEEKPPEVEDEGKEEPEPEEPEKDAPPKRDLGKRRSTVDQLAPMQSTFYALLVPRRIRTLPFAQTAMDIMTPLPDFQYLVVGGGFDPLRDFDHMVIASPDIRDVSQTFLAVDTKLPRTEVKTRLERAATANAETIAWTERQGSVIGDPRPDNGRDVDPRLFVLLPDDIIAFVRPEFLPHLLRDDTGADKTAGSYVANLTKLRRFAAKHPTAGLQVVAKNLRGSLRRAKGLPFDFPDHIEMLAEAQSSPELFIRVSFLTQADAEHFVKWWRDDLSKIIDENLAMRLYVGGLYDMIEIERVGESAELWGRFETEQARLVLEQLAGLSANLTRREAQPSTPASSPPGEDQSPPRRGANGGETQQPSQPAPVELTPTPPAR